MYHIVRWMYDTFGELFTTIFGLVIMHGPYGYALVRSLYARITMTEEEVYDELNKIEKETKYGLAIFMIITILYMIFIFGMFGIGLWFLDNLNTVVREEITAGRYINGLRPFLVDRYK